MKQVKFFAMLFAAFAMSVSLTACGDDDDEPDGGKPTTGKENVLTVGGKSANISRGYAFGMDFGIEIELMSEYDELPYGTMMLYIQNVKMENGYIPNGTYEFVTRNSEQNNKPFYTLNGSIMDANNGVELWFNCEEGSGKVKIERKGEEYTVTMSSLKVMYESHGEQPKYETISFTYKGGIMNHSQM